MTDASVWGPNASEEKELNNRLGDDIREAGVLLCAGSAWCVLLGMTVPKIVLSAQQEITRAQIERAQAISGPKAVFLQNVSTPSPD